MFGTVPNPLPTRAEYAYDHLRDWIVSGRLEPGQKLDQEWLASTLRVSRTPLRQALLRLEAEGLVEQRPYVGAIVAELSLHDLEDVYATRGAIESMLAREGTMRAQLEAITETKALLDAMASGTGDFVELDRRFHLTIYSLTGFRTALSLLDRLYSQSERYARVYAQDEIGMRRSVDHHRRIFEAFRAGDAEAAGRLTAEHIAHGKEILAEVVTERSSTLGAGT